MVALAVLVVVEEVVVVVADGKYHDSQSLKSVFSSRSMHTRPLDTFNWERMPPTRQIQTSLPHSSEWT